MDNRRRKDTDEKRAGTATGSVTFTVTLYPHIFEEDALLVEELRKLTLAKKANPYLRELAVRQFMGGSVEPVQNIKKAAIPAPKQASRSRDRDDSVANSLAESMGLKL